jgi:hypothetical protein
MELWDRLSNALDKGFQSSKELFEKAGDRARDLGERGVVRFEIMQLESQVEKLIGKLGARAYELFIKEGKASVTKSSAGVKDLLEQIAGLEARITEKESALAQMKASGEPTGDGKAEEPPKE